MYLKKIQKNLEGNKRIIIFDDLERRTESLDIKEVLGLVDYLTSGKSIRVILVSSIDNLPENEKDIFNAYSEKSIDRIYEITSYSNGAPENILGNEIWNSIKPIYHENSKTNLRTMEKVKYFIDEIETKNSDIEYSHKFNKQDLYLICGAVILFVVEHKKELVKIDKIEKESMRKSAKRHYEKPENRFEYINSYIIGNKLNNDMMKNLTSILLSWFMTGEIREEKLVKVKKQVEANNFEKIPLFMSEKELMKEITDITSYTDRGEGYISLHSFLKRLDELAYIAEQTKLDFKHDACDIVDWIFNKTNFIDYYEVLPHNILLVKQSKFIVNVLDNLNYQYLKKYNQKITEKLIMNRDKGLLNRIDVFENLKDLHRLLIYYEYKDEEQKFLSNLKNNEWYFPLPYGEIKEEHWTYCHLLLSAINQLSDKRRDIKKDAVDFFEEKIEKSKDEIFKYRMRSLINQYLIS
ncbi:hypothetical protein LNK15_08345 [Jeotgalicoccus huakuii]|nr:hypothetical protein [Jeotgalicoccus huakuii]